MEKTTRHEQREAVVVYHLRGSSVYEASTPGTAISHQPSRLYYISKRLIDIIISSISIIVLLPIFLIIAIYLNFVQISGTMLVT